MKMTPSHFPPSGVDPPIILVCNVEKHWGHRFSCLTQSGIGLGRLGLRRLNLNREKRLIFSYRTIKITDTCPRKEKYENQIRLGRG